MSWHVHEIIRLKPEVIQRAAHYLTEKYKQTTTNNFLILLFKAILMENLIRCWQNLTDLQVFQQSADV